MGIYDREYYQQRRQRVFGGFGTGGQVVKWLIIVNVAVFIVQMLTRQRTPFGLLPSPITTFFALDTAAVLEQGQVWRLLTYGFLHSDDLFHILFNMLFLYWFGRDLEEVYGPKEFLAFYLTAILAGGLGFTAFGAYFQLTGSLPWGQHTLRCIGASGGVTAVMLLCAFHFPNRIILLFFVIPVPIWAFVAFNVIQDAWLFTESVSSRNAFKTPTAVAAHLAGALFGFLYYRYQWRISRLSGGIRLKLPSLRRRPQLRVYRGERVEEPVAVGPREIVDEHLEAKLDSILAKIQAHGKDSLTEEEREILLRASEIYKKRR